MKGPEQRRHPRITLSERQDVQIELSTSQGPIRARVSDLAKGGLGILASSLSQTLKDALRAKTILPAKLEILDQVFDMEIEVVFAAGAVIGCSFKKKPSNFDAELDRYFKLELAALKMKRVDREQLKPVADGDPHWLFGTSGCELYFVTKADRIVRFNASYFSSFVEARANDEVSGVRYGRIIATETAEQSMNQSPSSIQWVDATPELKQTALKYFAVVPGLSDSERSQLLRWVHTGKPKA
jgi:hypothetical protein